MNYILILGILLLFGLLSTRVMKKVKLPNVTGFLIVGLLLGVVCIILDRTNTTQQFQNETLSESLSKINYFVSPIALGFIALSIGEEFRISKIKETGKKMALITVLQALLAVLFVDVAVIVACVLMNLNVSIGICLGAIATATAPAATLMVIHQYKAKGPLVDTLLPVVAFDDAIGLVVFAISTSIAKTFVGGNLSVISLLVLPLINVIGSILLGLILGFLLHLIMKFFESRNNHMVIVICFTLLGVGICLFLNTLKINGESLDFSSLLSCMMIGAVYVNTSKKEEDKILTRDIELMDRWTPFLFTLFFVLSGCHLATAAADIFNTSTNQLIVFIVIIFAIYIVMRSLGKYFGSYLGCKITKQDKNITKYLGLTLLPQAGVAIGMANTISGMEIFQKDNIANIIVTVVLCATLLYELVGPLLTKWALNKAGEIPPSQEIGK